MMKKKIRVFKCKDCGRTEVLVMSEDLGLKLYCPCDGLHNEMQEEQGDWVKGTIGVKKT